MKTSELIALLLKLDPTGDRIVLEESGSEVRALQIEDVHTMSDVDTDDGDHVTDAITLSSWS